MDLWILVRRALNAGLVGALFEHTLNANARPLVSHLARALVPDK
jgi:hypothetical protein